MHLCGYMCEVKALEAEMLNQGVKVRRETIAACMTCPLCNKLFRDPTTISECLHTFCKKCIYKKLLDEDLDSCPTCNIDLGCVPLEKLRPDHHLQDLRVKIFPFKRRKVKAPEVAPSVTLPVRRKERSLSSLVVSTPRVSTQSALTGKRSKAFARKAPALRGSGFPIEKPVKTEEDTMEDCPESFSSPETLTKFTQNIRQNFSNAETSSLPKAEKEIEGSAVAWEGKFDLWKPLNCLVEVANGNKSSKYMSQGSSAKSKPLHAPDNEGHIYKTKVEEQRPKSRVQDQKDITDSVYLNSVEPKKLQRIRKKKVAAAGELGVSPQAVLDAASANCERRNGPIWFSLVASEDQEGRAPLPQISANYLRIKNNKASDGNHKDSVELTVAGNRFLREYFATQVKYHSIHYWTPPPNGVYKVNFDGSLILEEKFAGVGIIVRDDRGRPIASMVEKLGAISDADHVGACAARVGLEFARDLGLQEIIMEGDSQSVVNALNLRSPEPCPLIEDLLRFSLCFRSCEWWHVLRGGNKAAHALAVHALTVNDLFVWMEEVPDFVLPIIQDDCNPSISL